MQLKRFALGIKFDFLSGTARDVFAMRMFEELFSVLTLPDLVGLEVYGGVMPATDETELGDIYIAVIMGGSLSRMRRVYQKIADDAAISMYLSHRHPFIENNRLENIEGLEFFGEVQKSGRLTGGSELLSTLRLAKKHGKRRAAGKGIKILLAPDAISADMTSLEAVKRLTLAARRHFQGIKIIPMPLTDGGKGTMNSLVIAFNGYMRQARLRMEDGEKRVAHYGALDGKTAVIEFAEVASLYNDAELVAGSAAVPTQTLGQLIRRALDEGLSRVLIGTGDAAANDHGMGLARALGVKFFDAQDNELLGGADDAERVFKADMEYLHPRVNKVKFLALIPDADRAYPPMPRALFEALVRAGMCESEAIALEWEKQGGELFVMLRALTGAEAVKGARAMLDAVGFDKLLKGVALVVTGCARLDGECVKLCKPVAEIMRRCSARMPVALLAGSLDEGSQDIFRLGNAGIMTLINTPMDEERARQECGRLFDNAADRMFRFIRMGRDVEKIGAPKKPRHPPYFDLYMESLKREWQS